MLSVAVDAVSTHVCNSLNWGGQNFSHTCGSGNLRLLVVGVISKSMDPTSMTYADVPMTKIATVNSPGSSYAVRSSLWVLHNPNPGANLVKFYWTGTLSARLVARSYSNVHVVYPYGTPKTFGGNTVNTVLTFPDSLNQGYSFHCGGFGGNATRTLGSGETTLFNNYDSYTEGSVLISSMVGEKATTGGNATLGMSSNAARDFAHVGVALFPYPGGRLLQILSTS